MAELTVDIIRSNLNYKIAHHLAFIINWAKGKRGSIGTGLFTEIQGRRFVITASHVVEDADDYQIYINLRIQDQKHVFKKLNRWNNDELDLAFLELEKSETEFMRDKIEPFYIGNKIKRGEKKNYNGLAICGYPITYHEECKPNYVIAGSFTIGLQYPLAFENWPERAKKEIDPENYFLISLKAEDIGQKLVDQDGRLPNGLDPHGMSGSPVWLFDVNKIDEKQPDYGFWGILTSYLTYEPNILKCTFINRIIEEIEKHYGFEI